jgi:tetratricopeptide (TPR) repeat protein
MEIETVPTTDLTAYDLYLKGMDYHSRSQRIDDFQFAIQMFNRAVEIDPNFTLAWIGLASASRHIYWFQFDRSDEHLVKIKKYLDKAIAIEPDLWEVQLEIGLYYYHCLLNYTEAIQILEKLKSDYPKNDQLYLWAGAIYRRMGQYEKAIEYMDNAILLNPFDWNYWYNAGETLIILAKYQQAEEYFNYVIELNPSGIEGYVILAELYLMTGEIEKARILINNQQIKDPAMYLLGSQAELLDRNYQEAIEILNSSPEKVVTNNLSYKPISMQIGLIYHMMSNSKLANVHFQVAREDLEGKLSELPYDSRLYSSLGIVYGGLGLKEKAMAAGNEALDIMNISIDAWMGFYREWDMARILLLVGENDKAIDKLEWLLHQNGDLSIELLKRDPFWDPLRNIDAFNILIENPKYQIKLGNN